jgi:uncharacterized protein YbjQ (UPF0145 family)
LSRRPRDCNQLKGGWSGSYETALRDARRSAIGEITDNAVEPSGNAVIGVNPAYETLGSHGSRLKLTAAGTGVWIA